MKFITRILLALILPIPLGVMAAEPAAAAPRIVTLTGAAFPKALIQAVSAKDGVALFAWLDADGKQVDSGGSVARFTPLAPFPPAEGASPDAAPVYPEVPDATLASAIANPPTPAPAVGVWTTLTFLGRFTDPEKAAVFTSADVEVIVARSLGLAAQEIRTDDPRTQALMSLLVAKGLLTEARKTVILTP